MFVQGKKIPLALCFNSEVPSIVHTTTGIAGREPLEFSLLSLPIYLAERALRLLEAYGER